MSNIKGVIPAVPTPFTANGEIAIDAFIEHCQWCLNNGASALNVLGTTGEANSLSVAQRKQVMTAAATQLDRSRLMVGTAVPDLATTIELTKLAAELGFAAALVLPPFYYKPVAEDGLFAWFSRIIEATADRPIDIYLYNFPQLTGIAFSPSFAARLKAAFPERLKGAKDSSGNLDYARELTAIADFAVFPSSETSLAQADQSGFAGCISASVNVDPRCSDLLWRDQENAELQTHVRELRTGIAAYPLVAAVKHLVGRRSGNQVWSNVMPPNMPLTDPAAQSSLADLVEAREKAA
ncbi:dihydrodipicolinate synthase [Rhizobium sp. Root149]|uniref:4-hydroxy-tetrahydrodipicolinate synthase n=1 Tax=Rhizobium rhizoryzae TaxID=451876 RepID=A0A7W6LKL9_9HYPH|nr:MULTISPECIES: dihydrodipicolinate synthase family protein [Rhizobium]KQZ55695.1 dihydrodipicolinate synthase [Rhizobium sp. Root149]MBB4146074.1 4-hydroxy-tetrahydrodipicolinate synthase [Rhizobium rhizoryzae]